MTAGVQLRVMKDFLQDKQFIVLRKLKTTELLTDKTQKHRHRVLTEEKLDDIGASLEHTSRKSVKRLGQENGVSNFKCKNGNTTAEAIQWKLVSGVV
jgi:hypothetical protein